MCVVETVREPREYARRFDRNLHRASCPWEYEGSPDLLDQRSMVDVLDILICSDENVERPGLLGFRDRQRLAVVAILIGPLSIVAVVESDDDYVGG